MYLALLTANVFVAALHNVVFNPPSIDQVFQLVFFFFIATDLLKLKPQFLLPDLSGYANADINNRFHEVSLFCVLKVLTNKTLLHS